MLVAILATGCGDERSSAASRERERILLADPLRELVVPGGTFLGEASAAGSPPEFGDQDPVVVNRSWSFEGDPLDLAVPIARQVQDLGWTITGGGCYTGVLIYASKLFDGFLATVRIQAQTRQSGERHLTVRIRAPFPGEEEPITSPIRSQVPECFEPTA